MTVNQPAQAAENKEDSMYSLIVLGLVPGTNFQITFEFWLQCLEALAAAVLITKLGLIYINRGKAGLKAVDAYEFKLPAKLPRRSA